MMRVCFSLPTRTARWCAWTSSSPATGEVTSPFDSRSGGGCRPSTIRAVRRRSSFPRWNFCALTNLTILSLWQSRRQAGAQERCGWTRRPRRPPSTCGRWRKGMWMGWSHARRPVRRRRWATTPPSPSVPMSELWEYSTHLRVGCNCSTWNTPFRIPTTIRDCGRSRTFTGLTRAPLPLVCAV